MDPVPAYRHCPVCAGALEPRSEAPDEPAFPTCTACGFIFYLDPKVSAGAVVVWSGELVLLRRAIEPARGKWVYPGGYVNRGETTGQAAVRETEEEVGMCVTVRDLLGVYSYEGRSVVVVVYAADAITGPPRAGREALEVRTFPPEEIPWDELAFPSTRDGIRDYLRRYGPLLAG
jgi:ADP-ribose pyrophosphatase YjhB (NUDIX family)